MRRHPKGCPARPRGLARAASDWRAGLGAAAATLLLMALLLPGMAAAAPKGITGFFGNSGSTGETIGGRFSTTPQGIAVNDSTGDVYVADAGNNRIERFDADGDFEWALGFDVIANGKPGNQPQNEVQELAMKGAPTGGTFTFRATTNTESTSVPFNATPAQVKAALESLPAFGPGSVDVTLAPGGNPGGGSAAGGPWIVEFVGSLADTNLAAVRGVTTGLTPSGATLVATTTVEGAGVVERCTVAADCKSGTPLQSGNFRVFATAVPGGGFAGPLGIAIDQDSGDLYVSDPNFARVQQLDADGNFIRAWGGNVARSGPEQANESQRLSVDATSGTYRLSYYATSGRGVWAAGSTQITEVSAFSGSFAVGQPITGRGIPAGTTIAAVGAETLTLSAATFANGTANTGKLAAGPISTTADIAWNEPAAGIEAKLAATGIGAGNVSVAAGPTGTASYLVSFAGSLAGTNVAPLTVSGGSVPLAGGRGALVLTYTEGAEGPEICEVAANCNRGIGGEGGGPGGTFAEANGPAHIAVAPVGAPNAGNVIVSTRDRIDEYTPGGRFIRAFGFDTTASGPGNQSGASEVQKVTVSATGGSFQLTLGGSITPSLPATATASQVEAALNDLASIGGIGGWVTVSGGPGNASGSSPYVITFGGALQGSNVSQLAASNNGLTGGSPSQVAVATISDGVPTFEVCRAEDLDICKEGSAGSGVGQMSISNSKIRVAVDTSGAIYALESACQEQARVRRVQKFTPQVGRPDLSPSIFAESLLSVSSPCATTNVAPEAIAVDSADDHVFVVKAYEAGEGTPPAASPERRLLEFDGAGNLLETSLVGYNVPAVNGLALKQGADPIYLTSPSPTPGVFIAGAPTPPTAAIAASTGITATCATLHGSVNPEGGGPLHTLYRFEYRPTGTTDWSKAPVPDADVGSGETPVSVESTVCSLQPNRPYEVRLVAVKGGSPVVSAGTAGDFTTDAAPVSVQTFGAFWDTNSEELVLRGTVNPNNSPATYYFQYGTESCSSGNCLSEPEAENAPAGSGGAPLVVSKRVSGLLPNQIYHFRLVADNGVETSPGQTEVVGTELTFTTPSASVNPCPNQQLRTGASARLGECRGFEWVSKGDSWGSGLNPVGGSISDDGARAQFFAQAFGQPQSVPGPSTPYIAERTGTEWSVRQVVPPAASAEGSYSGSRFMTAADLGSVLWPQSSIGQRLRGEVRWGTVGIDGSEDWVSDQLVPISHSGPGAGGDEYVPRGASVDLSTLLFQFASSAEGTSVTLVPGEPLLGAAGRSNLYQVSAGELTIVNRSTDPAPGSPGALIGGVCGAGLGSQVVYGETGSAKNAVSADGSVVHFSARPGASSSANCSGATVPKRLFKRIDGSTTVELSACAKANPNACMAAGNDLYEGASRDGAVTFFTTPRQLVDSDTDSTDDLYVYDESLPPGGRLILASAGEVVTGDHPTVGSGADVQTVLDNSADGSRVYFVARGRLTSEATAGAKNIYVFERGAAHPGGRIAFVGALTDANLTTRPIAQALPGGESGDGHFLLFLSFARLLSEDVDSSNDLYRYDDLSHELRCLSCMGEEEADVSLPERETVTSWPDFVQRSRVASDDVSSVVFTTPENLVSEDTNGVQDVYLWRDGSLALVSPGTEATGAIKNSGAISPDGEDVFFITGVGLVEGDKNNSLDLYDARVGGGFPESVPAIECESGPACQGPATTAPGGESSGSDAFVGPGNVAQPKPCKKGKVRRHGKCTKKVSKKHHKQKSKRNGKRAGHDRGGRR